MKFERLILLICILIHPLLSYSKYDQQLIAQVKQQTKSLCYEVDFLTAHTIASFWMPTVPARFFLDSFMKSYTRFDFSNTEEVDLFLFRYRSLFKQTLAECWPDDPRFQKKVLVMIELSIWEGRAVGVISQLGMIKGAAWSYKRLLKYSKWIAAGALSSFGLFFGYSKFDLIEDDIEQIEDDFEIIESNVDVEELRSLGIDLDLVANAKNRITMLEDQLKNCDENCEQLEQALNILKQVNVE